MKKLLKLLIILCFGIFLVSCKENDPKDETSDLEPVITMQDYKDDLLLYESRLNELTTIDGNPETSSTSNFKPTFLSNYEQSIYFREEIQNVYDNSSIAIIEESYVEQLLTTRDFIETVNNLIADDLNKPVGEKFYPDDENEQLTYQFFPGEEGYIIIESINGIEHSFIKIRMNDDKLEYSELHYSYTNTSDTLIALMSLRYNYFTFQEGIHAIYFNDLVDYVTLNITSIENNQQFSIAYGSNVVESENPEDGYSINYYDGTNSINVYLNVVNEEIVDETYDVFGEHGLLYRFENHVYNESIKLTINILEANGWDKIEFNEEDEQQGTIYNGETELYNGHIRFTYTDNHAWVAFDQLILKEDLSQTHFDLNEFELQTTHEKISYSWINNLRITSFEEVKTQFMFEDLDIFSDDVHFELYNFIDQDIIDCLEGNNGTDDDVIATGDVDSFLNAIDIFQTNFDINPQLVSEESIIYNITDTETNTTTFSTGFARTELDYNELYFATSIQSDYTWESFIVEGSTGSLVAFQVANGLLDYEILYEEASIENFDEYVLQNFSGNDPLQGVETVTKVNDLVYSLELSYQSLGATTEFLFEQQGITGLRDAEITMTYKFNSTGTSYEVTLEITGLYFIEFTHIDVDYLSNGTITITNVNVRDPLNEELFAFLPTSQDSIIFLTPYEYNTRYYVHEESSWIAIQLESGAHSIGAYANFTTPEFVIYDSNNNQIAEGEHFTIEEDGLYFIKVTTNREDSVNIYIGPSTLPSIFYDTLDDFSSNYTGDFLEYAYYFYNVPVKDYDRVLYLNFDTTQAVSEHPFPGMFGTEQYEALPSGCLEDESTMECYYYIRTNEEIQISFSSLVNAELYFNYTYIDFPQTPQLEQQFDITFNVPTDRVLLSENNPSVRYNFTITEQGSYYTTVDITALSFINAFSTLYDSNGNVLDDFVLGRSLNLPPGEYYIIVDISHTVENPMFIIFTLE